MKELFFLFPLKNFSQIFFRETEFKKKIFNKKFIKFRQIDVNIGELCKKKKIQQNLNIKIPSNRREHRRILAIPSNRREHQRNLANAVFQWQRRRSKLTISKTRNHIHKKWIAG